MADGGDAMTKAGWAEHPLRGRVLGEVHARPFRRIEPPHTFLHYAFQTPSDAVAADFAFFGDWCRSLGVAPPDTAAKVHNLPLLGGNLCWEQHSEFVSYTFDAEPAIAAVQDPFGARFRPPGGLLVAARVDVIGAGDDPSPFLKLMDEASLCFSAVLDGMAQVATDFHPDRDGLVRILVVDRGLSARRLGSLVQAMLEIETYRVFALLGLPKAMEQTPEIRSLERRTATIVEKIRHASDISDNRKLLEGLFDLAVEVETSAASSSHRFSASRAYFEIALDRIRMLGEEGIDGSSTIAIFLNRRLAPAMRTCEVADQRQQQLSRKLTRVANLLRTRVDVEMEEQNGRLLQSMDRRANQQLMLQHTVEGLSVAAVSYYIIGIISHLIPAIPVFSHGIEPEIVEAGLVIPVVAFVWWLMHGIRKRHGG